ncbi:MAG TPA: ParA family protein [Armatimonadota bacterium]|nr:ParA family protein [Armatimonadota bacterium]HOS42239.1 ParA family protein [Armatimonadota bacterium]
MTKTLAIVNQKGGVGKTTTAVNLATGLARAGHRTLLVDLDPQGNATTGAGVEKSRLEATVYDLLLGDRAWSAVTVASAVEGLDVIPATLELAGAVVELATLPEREVRLRHGLRGADARYRFIIIDTPPSLGLLPVNTLAAADAVLVPMQCEFYALEGLAQLEYTLRLVKRGLNPALEILGILLTMVDTRMKLCRDVSAAVRRQYGARVFKTAIPRTIRLSEAPSYGETIFTYDPRGKGARAYLTLTQEVMDRC